MTVAMDATFRGWSQTAASPAVCLEDKFEILKDIGDGSFGSVVLGRTRSAGAHIARRGSLVAIKTMKKTFEDFSQCLELREVIFLKSLPNHPHLVPAYDIFLDPLSKKLHIAMEYMDGNLYQLMKTREHKPFDGSSVKSILFQILAGLEHIHENGFFHRDIKPENILVTTSVPDTSNAFKRYSQLVTPPSTPPTYTIKLADFGLARETHSRVPYTTYVSTRWYRAPEVLLRAGEYSAPVDMWALGAMAVEIATLKPLFPGGNEVDQVWRVCEIMGSPGTWVSRQGGKVGGGEWKDGVRLAQKLGFSFPKMAPHAIDTILLAPQWPASLSHFVTWCLMWDPKARPTSTQALQHEYFVDAVDPLRPKSASTPRLLSRKQSSIRGHDSPDSTHGLTSKTSSWFRKSLSTKELPSPVVTTHQNVPQIDQETPQRPLPVHANTTTEVTPTVKARPAATKRATWNNGAAPNAAPIPILPSIRPISPLPDVINAQASARITPPGEKAQKKIGRQLSVNSHGNHYADYHRLEAEKALTGTNGLGSPTGSAKESFFSHLRKRARRLSGRNQTPVTHNIDDIEANAGCAPWSNRQSMSMEQPQQQQQQQPANTTMADPSNDPSFAELDKALQNVRYSLDAASQASPLHMKQVTRMPSNPALERHHSLYGTDGQTSATGPSGAVAARTRKSIRQAVHPSHRYETPDEEDELLDEALASAHKAARRLDKASQAPKSNDNGLSIAVPRPTLPHVTSDPGIVPYLTPSPSKDNNRFDFTQGETASSKPMDIPGAQQQQKNNINPQWPTPPYEENEWAASAAASIYAAAQAAYR